MAELRDELLLDLRSALQSVGELDSALASVASNFSSSISEALGAVDAQAVADEISSAVTEGLEEPDKSIEIESADASVVTEEIDESITAADTAVLIDEADAGAVADAIEEAVAGADTQIELQADSTDLQTLGAAAEGASEGIGELASGALVGRGALSALGGASELTAGNFGGLASKAGVVGGAIAGTAALVATFFNAAEEAERATRRLQGTFGEFADDVEQIDIGGLNESLSDLALRTGSSDDAIRIALSNIGELGKISGRAAEDVANTAEQMAALANFVAATRPELGSADQILDQLSLTLARGGRFAARFGLDLQAAEIEARALKDTGKATADELTIFDKAAAGAAIAVEKLGTGLGEGIQRGSQQGIVQLRSLKTFISETIEELGKPTVVPILEFIQEARPLLTVVFRVLGDIAKVATIVVQGLTLVLRAAQDVGEFFDGIGDKIDELKSKIPGLGRLGDAFEDALPPQLRGIKALFDYINAEEQVAASTSTVTASNAFLSSSFLELTDSVTGSTAAIVEQLPPALEAAKQFGEGLEPNLKTAKDVFASFATESSVNIQKVTKALQDQTKSQTEFFDNIQKIIDRGAPETARKLLELGPVQGAALAKSAVTAKQKHLEALEQANKESDKALEGFGAKTADLYFKLGGEQGDAYMRGLLAGLESRRGEVSQTAHDIAEKNVVAEMSSVFAIESPSQVAKRMGELFIEGLLIPFRQAPNRVAVASRNVARAIEDAASLGRTPDLRVRTASTAPAAGTTSAASGGVVQNFAEGSIQINEVAGSSRATAFEAATLIGRRSIR